MYYCSLTNNYIYPGSDFTIEGVTYPFSWIQQVPPEELQALGIELVVASNTPADPRFYFVSEQLEGAVLTYINTPKDINMVKNDFTKQIKDEAYGLLQPTDYIDIRNLRDPSYKPDWVTWRDSVRTYASDTTTAINAAEDISEIETIMASFSWPNNPSYVAPAAPAVVSDLNI